MSEIEENGDDGSGVRISDFPDPIGTKTIYDYLVVCGGRGVSVLSRAVSRVIKSNPCPNTFSSTLILCKEELNTVRTAKWAYSRIAGSMCSLQWHIRVHSYSVRQISTIADQMQHADKFPEKDMTQV